MNLIRFQASLPPRRFPSRSRLAPINTHRSSCSPFERGSLGPVIGKCYGTMIYTRRAYSCALCLALSLFHPIRIHQKRVKTEEEDASRSRTNETQSKRKRTEWNRTGRAEYNLIPGRTRYRKATPKSVREYERNRRSPTAMHSVTAASGEMQKIPPETNRGSAKISFALASNAVECWAEMRATKEKPEALKTGSVREAERRREREGNKSGTIEREREKGIGSVKGDERMFTPKQERKAGFILSIYARNRPPRFGAFSSRLRRIFSEIGRFFQIWRIFSDLSDFCLRIRRNLLFLKGV